MGKGITTTEPGVELEKIVLAISLQKIAIQVPTGRLGSSSASPYCPVRLGIHSDSLVGLSCAHGQFFLGGEADVIFLAIIENIDAVLRRLDDFLNNHKVLSPQRRQRTFRHGLPA